MTVALAIIVGLCLTVGTAVLIVVVKGAPAAAKTSSDDAVWLRAIEAPTADGARSFQPPTAAPIPVFPPSGFDSLGGPPPAGFDLTPDEAVGIVHPPVGRTPHVCHPVPLGPVPPSMLRPLRHTLETLAAGAGNSIAAAMARQFDGLAVTAEAQMVCDRLQAEVQSVHAAFGAVHQAHDLTDVTAQFARIAMIGGAS